MSKAIELSLVTLWQVRTCSTAVCLSLASHSWFPSYGVSLIFFVSDQVHCEYISYSRLKSSVPAIFRTKAAHFQGPMTLLLNVRISYNVHFHLQVHSTKTFRGFAQSYSKCCLQPHTAHSVIKISSQCLLQIQDSTKFRIKPKCLCYILCGISKDPSSTKVYPKVPGQCS